MVPSILPVVMSFDSGDVIADSGSLHLVHQTLLTLTNMAALSDWHKQMTGALNK